MDEKTNPLNECVQELVVAIDNTFSLLHERVKAKYHLTDHDMNMAFGHTAIRVGISRLIKDANPTQEEFEQMDRHVGLLVAGLITVKLQQERNP